MIKIFMAECENTELTNFECGAIAKVTEDKFYIMTGNGFIVPTAIQFGSFFVGNTRDFINILNPKVGEVFS